MTDKNISTAIDMFKACVAILAGYLCFNLSTYLIVSPLVALLVGQGVGYSSDITLAVDLLCNFFVYSLAVFLACLFAGRLAAFTGIAIAVLSAATYNGLIVLPDIRAGNYRLWYIVAANLTIASGTLSAIWVARKSLRGPLPAEPEM